MTITVGVEQEINGYAVCYDLAELDKKKYPKCFATVSYISSNHVTQPCVYITGDTISIDTQSGKQIVRQTLELSTQPVNHQDDKNRQITKYVLDTIIQLVSVSADKKISYENIIIPAHTFSYYDDPNGQRTEETVEFCVRNDMAELCWYISSVHDKVTLANQVTIGMDGDLFAEYIKPGNAYRPAWIKKTNLDKDDIKETVIHYGRNLIYKSGQCVYRYIMNTIGKSQIDYDVKKADVETVLTDINHAELKNYWDILPRTPLYRALEQFDVKLEEDILKDPFLKTGNDSLDLVIETMVGKYKDAYREDKTAADWMLHAGILDISYEDGRPIYLFEYRHISNDFIQLKENIFIDTREFLGKINQMINKDSLTKCKKIDCNF